MGVRGAQNKAVIAGRHERKAKLPRLHLIHPPRGIGKAAAGDHARRVIGLHVIAKNLGQLPGIGVQQHHLDTIHRGARGAVKHNAKRVDRPHIHINRQIVAQVGGVVILRLDHRKRAGGHHPVAGHRRARGGVDPCRKFAGVGARFIKAQGFAVAGGGILQCHHHGFHLRGVKIQPRIFQREKHRHAQADTV